MEEKRFYYKDQNGNYYNYKSEHTEENLIPITEEEFEAETAIPEPSEGQLASQQILDEISSIISELASYDYIGVKIAMGVATREEYADKIAYTETLRARVNELEAQLKEMTTNE